MKRAKLAAMAAMTMMTIGCGSSPEPVASPAPAPTPAAAQRYAALPDTVVCVVDRTTERGLRDLTAKKAENGQVVLMVENQIKPLDELHPVGVIAGYAGQENWFTRGQPVSTQSRSFVKYGGERRIPLAQLRRVGEFQGIPLFGAPTDPPLPPAVYVPVRVGCIFQAYVREDLYRG